MKILTKPIKTHLKLVVKSYYLEYINEFTRKFEKYFHRDLNFIKFKVVLPAKIERYTLLRSPHADKKARDQFERKTYKRLFIINIEVSQENNVYILYYFLQTLSIIAIGVEFRIIYEISKV